MLKRIASIQGADILAEADRVFFIADADIDCDGPNGNPHGDRSWQRDTTLHHNGAAIDSYLVPGVVVPPIIIKSVPGIVLGCRADVTYRKTGIKVACVVYDIGPTVKIGEVSVCAAVRLGMPANPNTGGEEDINQVIYEIFPGVPAVIDGITYTLQHYR